MNLSTSFRILEKLPTETIIPAFSIWAIGKNWYLSPPDIVKAVEVNGEPDVEWVYDNRREVDEKFHREMGACLGDFCKLASGSTEDVLLFVQKWDVFAFMPDVNIGVLHGDIVNFIYREPVSVYVEWARKLTAFLHIVIDLANDEKPNAEYWDVLGQKTYVAGDLARWCLANFVTDFLNDAGVRPVAEVTGQKRITLSLSLPECVDFAYDSAKAFDRPYTRPKPHLLSLYNTPPEAVPIPRSSRLRSVLGAQIMLILQDPNWTRCAVCGMPCQIHRRDKNSYCSAYCRKVKQGQWSNTYNRKRRAAERADREGNKSD